MFSKAKFFTSTALATLLLAQSASADITAQELWGEFKQYMQSYGYSVSSTEALVGDALNVTDIRLSMPIPDDDGVLDMTVESLTFEPDGNGAVRIILPSQSVLGFEVESDKDDIDFEADILYSHQGLDVLVSGDVTDLTMDYTSVSSEISLSKLIVDGEEIGPDVARGSIQTEGTVGQTVLRTGETRHSIQSYATERLTYDVAINDPEGEGNLLASGSMTGLKMEADSTLPLELTPEQLANFASSDIAVEAMLSNDGSSSTFAFTDDGSVTTAKSSSDGASLLVKMDQGGVRYDAKAAGLSFDMNSPEIPLPISAQMEEMSFVVDLPLVKADSFQDYEIGVTLGGFSTSDLIWNMFDPAAVLSRDPATIVIDIVGQAKVLVDLFDEESVMAAASSGQMVGELDSMTLRELTISAAGAEVSGTGSFTFDNSDFETFDGIPRPIGAIDLSVVGANGLIDNLIKMGLLEQGDAMGARMMMSMFTVPAGGQDNLKSKLEINEQGHISANGQRIK